MLLFTIGDGEQKTDASQGKSGLRREVSRSVMLSVAFSWFLQAADAVTLHRMAARGDVAAQTQQVEKLSWVTWCWEEDQNLPKVLESSTVSWIWLPIAGGRLPSSCACAIRAWSCTCSWACKAKTVWYGERRRESL